MKVLFITSTRIGDAILSTGILDALGTQYPNVQITVVCGFLPQSLFEAFPCVTTIIPLKKKKYHGHWLDLWKKVGLQKWDMVVDLRNTIVSRLVYADKKYIYDHHIDKTQHKVKQAAQLLCCHDIPSPKLYFSEKQNSFADALIPKGKTIIAVGPSANWIGKTWEAEKFIVILQWLTQANGFFPDAMVAVFAAPGEETQARKVLEAMPPERRIDGIAKGNPAEVAAAIARCAFYLGNDSGLMHAAAATGVKTFGVFGPSYPHLYAPWGDHTAFVQTDKNFDALTDFVGYNPKTLSYTLMSDLSVEAVRNAITAFLTIER